MWDLRQGDCLELMRAMPADSVDLVFGSPPYEEARLYLENGVNMGISRKTDAWVSWMVEVFQAAQAACKGLVAFVVAGQTRKFRWSAGPVLLMAELHRAGMNLRNPPIFHRVGIPGSGGPDWLRADFEWIVCTSRPGKLPWSDNTVMGHAPKWAPGGEMSHRLSSGTRVNQWGNRETGVAERNRNGVRQKKFKPSHRMHTKTRANGEMEKQEYTPPVLANPGNVISIPVGGGKMGGDIYAAQNEAPFPEALAEFFVRSFAPVRGTVLDPFAGSCTTGAVAIRWQRNYIGIDIRQSMIDLGRRRLENETPLMKEYVECQKG